MQQRTIESLLKATIVAGSLIYTDEYAIYDALAEWGYEHKTVCHGAGKYARDDDGDGLCEVHVNTMEGFWSGYGSQFSHSGGKSTFRPITNQAMDGRVSQTNGTKKGGR